MSRILDISHQEHNLLYSMKPKQTTKSFLLFLLIITIDTIDVIDEIVFPQTLFQVDLFDENERQRKTKTEKIGFGQFSLFFELFAVEEHSKTFENILQISKRF